MRPATDTNGEFPSLLRAEKATGGRASCATLDAGQVICSIVYRAGSELETMVRVLGSEFARSAA